MFNIFTVIRSIALVIISGLIALAIIVPSQSHPHLSVNSKVGVNSIGNIKIGMTKEEAELVSGVKLLPNLEQKPPPGYSTEFCSYLYPDNDLQIGFMMSQNHIVRIDIDDEKIKTISGAKLGDTEEKIIAIYPSIKITTGFYSGKYLIYKPEDPAYQEYRLLFEAKQPYQQSRASHLVKTYRFGYQHEVSALVEGCS